VTTEEDDLVLAGVRAATPAQWERLWAAVDRLQRDTASWVEWVPAFKRADGVTVLGWPQYSEPLEAVLRGLSGVGAVTPAFDWPAWRQSPQDPSRSAADAVRWITSVVRSERFGDGSIDAAMRDGTLLAAVGRLRRWHAVERDT
jgi:hypothetical protein